MRPTQLRKALLRSNRCSLGPLLSTSCRPRIITLRQIPRPGVTVDPLKHFHFPDVRTTFRSYVPSRRLAAKEYPPHTLYPLPALSPTMQHGTIGAWTLREGDRFAAGDVLCSIETDKASVDYEAQDDGVLAKILRQGDSAVDISIGVPICVVVEDASDVPAFADFTVDDGSVPEPSKEAVAVDDSQENASVADSGTSMLMPSARHLSESKGLDATGLKGTGKGGRVTKGDVMAAIAAGGLPASKRKTAAEKKSVSASDTVSSPPTEHAKDTATPSPSAPATPTTSTPVFRSNVAAAQIDSSGAFTDLVNNKMRKIIASRLTESKRDVPHFYTSIEVELDKVLSLRKKLASYDVKVSVNDFIIRCSALALRDVPEVNASFDTKTGTIQRSSTIDVSVAVATPTGLITPIVFHTDRLGLAAITATVRDLAGRARDGKLAPQEYQGGTFSVSNLGMFGIDEFSAVINPPQAAILAVGGGARRVVAAPYIDGVQPAPSKPLIRTVMTARLSADRRVVDEATASLFLSVFRHYLNDPELLLL